MILPIRFLVCLSLLFKDCLVYHPLAPRPLLNTKKRVDTEEKKRKEEKKKEEQRSKEEDDEKRFKLLLQEEG